MIILFPLISIYTILVVEKLQRWKDLKELERKILGPSNLLSLFS